MYIGQILRNRYKITKNLASGGFADTYLAEDIDLPNHQEWVVKHLRRNPNPEVLQLAKRLFESEAQVLYRLGNECDQIPKLFSHFEENGEFYLVQEFIDGQDLSREIYPGKQSSEAEVTQLLQEILEVFIIIHTKNIIHRDIKPANLIRRYKDGKIVVIDFGAVKEIGTLTVNAQGQTIPSVAIGTVGYMPSEQASGQPKLSSDVYAIGMLGIYALTGIQPHELPKDPKNGEVIWRNWANVSESMADVLTKMVRYNFSDRYQSAFEALDAVTTLKPKVKPQPQPDPKQRREILKILGWLGTGVGLSFVGGQIFMRDTQGQKSDVAETSDSSSRPSSPIAKTSTKSNLLLQTFNFETVTVNGRGNIINRRKLDAKYFSENLPNGVTLQMVQIPEGTFMRGSPESEAWRTDDESPQRQVKVPGFFMGRYEVTQAQYQAIMGNNPATFKGANLPVETVSLDDAMEFCKKLSQKTGHNYRLPSEAEWEYACRAGTTTPFYFGETITTDLANYKGIDTNTLSGIFKGNYGQGPKGLYRAKTTEVGIFTANAFGLYDMHGNVLELCEDMWHDNYDGAPDDGSPWLSNGNPLYAGIGLVRGGSFDDVPASCRSANRVIPGSPNPSLGFRVVLVA